jgi:ubiquinone/menaquinone biosynthesis C-methylase UbiE
MKRVATRELLDTDSGTPAEVAGSLSDLNRINHWFGGIASTEEMVARVARETNATSLSLLEVAAGSGYVSENVRQRLDKRGLRLDVTLLDRVPSHLSNGNQTVAGDALALPFRDESFDLVGCNLFAHHLSPRQLVEFVDDALRVCRIALLIDDIVRHPVHLSLVYAALPLFRSRLTWHDAPASVRQAYKPQEFQALLAQTKAARVEIHRHFLFRIGVTAWKY